ncbi:MAG: HypC/HybG/HupF family hydrogenase formation chaperone [Candidatus Latescibacteria bacterium]|nr:HypC/HybG/HupF family hydrogenase formation chaperone [Candidatus Latescibacterota bacterium]
MCLAIPMKVIKIKGSEGIVELSGVEREVNLQLVEDVSVGDYILIHAGFAIQKLDREEAEETLSYLRQMAEKA